MDNLPVIFSRFAQVLPRVIVSLVVVAGLTLSSGYFSTGEAHTAPSFYSQQVSSAEDLTFVPQVANWQSSQALIWAPTILHVALNFLSQLTYFDGWLCTLFWEQSIRYLAIRPNLIRSSFHESHLPRAHTA